MRVYLRLLGAVLLIGGLATCVVAASFAVRDETFFNAGEALARHPDHVLFQGEYYAALLRHIAYILTALVGGFLGTIGSATLFGLHAILVRLERVEVAATAPHVR
jgi:hypothetical protein